MPSRSHSILRHRESRAIYHYVSLNDMRQTVGSKPCVVILAPLCPPPNQLASNRQSVVGRQVPMRHSMRPMILNARTAPNQMSPNGPSQNGRAQNVRTQNVLTQKPPVQNVQAARMHLVVDREAQKAPTQKPSVDRETLELANTVFSLYNRWNAQQRTTDSRPSPAAFHFRDVNQSVHSQSAIATPSSNANNTKMDSGEFVVGRPSTEQFSAPTEHRGIKKEAVYPPPRPPVPAESERKFKCTMAGCGKTFKRTVDIRRHLNKHLNNGQFSCSQCDRRFVYQCDLSRHRRRCRSRESQKSVGQRSFECNVCHKRFAQKHRLTLHLAKTHGV